MTLCVDASVSIKWVLPEANSLAARALIGAEILIAPDYMLLECASVLAREERRGVIDRAVAEGALARIERAGVRLLPWRTHFQTAQALALSLRVATYDCRYLAVALAEGCPMITADAKFAAIAGAAYPAAVRSL